MSTREQSGSLSEDSDLDGSRRDKIYRLYNAKSMHFDSEMVSRFKGSMDSLLVFSGLFSAVATAFIIESYQFLVPDDGAALLTWLPMLSADTVDAKKRQIKASANLDSIQPMSNAVAFNVLFALALIGSLTAAFGAILIQGWVARYIVRCTRSQDVFERARDRAWYFDGMNKSGIDSIASWIHVILHLSLFLFLAGFILFLFSVNVLVASAPITAIALVGIVYLTFALIHLFMESTPYSTPFSTFLVNMIFGSIIAIGVAIFLGVSLFLAGIILGIVLLACALAIPFLPFWYKVWIAKIKSFSEGDPATVARSISMAAYKGTQHTQVVSRMLGTRSGSVRDKKALEWLLPQVATVTDLEELVDGIPPFIEKSPEKEVYANIIVELGGRDVGALGAGLGRSLGLLLRSCTHVGSVVLVEDHRRARALSASGAMVSIFCHCDPEKRIESVPISEAAPDVMREIFYDYSNDCALPYTRWADWLDVFLWEPILALRQDPDDSIKQHVTYLITLLFHCALSDIANRMHCRDVEIYSPSWDIRTLLAALKRGDERPELYELAVALLLVPGLEDPTEAVIPTFGLPAYVKAWIETKKSRKAGRGRAIEVVVKKASGGEETHLVDHEKFRNEAMLLALTTLIDQIPVSTVVDHSDTLSRIISAIAKKSHYTSRYPAYHGTAAGTSPSMQRAFVDAVNRHRVAALGSSAPEVTVIATKEAGPARTSRLSVRSVFRIPGVIDDIVHILESVEDPQSLATVAAILSYIRTTQPTVQTMFQKQIIQRASIATDKDSLGEGGSSD